MGVEAATSVGDPKPASDGGSPGSRSAASSSGALHLCYDLRVIYATLEIKEATVPRRLDTSFHEQMVARRLQDPEFREEYERARRVIEQVDSVIRRLDELRDNAGLSKAELARRIGREPSSIRRLFTAQSNPELLLVASIAEDLDADVRVVPRNTVSSLSAQDRAAGATF